MFQRLAYALLLILLLSPRPGFAADQVYRIGNSLTWDSQPKGIEALATQHKLTQVQAWHINCGKSLDRIWSHPEEICVKAVEPFNTYRNALPNHEWKAVTFQPHPGASSTLRTDTDCILNMIKLAQSNGRNKQTVFYIYAAWPGQPLGAYRDVWTQPTPDKDDAMTIQSRAYFAHLIKRVRKQTDADVRMIPVGEVVFNLDALMRDGKLANYKTAADLYRDKVHMNHVGRFIAGVTTLTTLTGKDPITLTCPPKHYGGGKDFNANLYKTLHQTVWKTVTTMHDVTGVR